ncbi:DUF5977 domain-containing protein [Mucilaginibacter sp. McL0603]|uniref:DUF5977 domain-containing protein n=1 Tax=Mucilaginibacter sp. McL0603 TaxID=3415670 RepID=UPI003CE82760
MPFTKKTRIKRAAALFMLFTLLNQIFAPSVAYALTAGPTAPEATSFEPVDTTDMVNPINGSFTDNIPLLEVPGPEGSYPLSLSYHAGIQPNEEASWVGLGWSLNTGAISRNVNGYPDDWAGGTGSNFTYWHGGSTNSFNIGVSVGLANSPATVNAGLSFSQDTYRGFGVGTYAGLGMNTGSYNFWEHFNRSPFDLGIKVGISPYGDAYAAADIGVAKNLGIDGLTASSGIGVQTNFKSISAGFDGGLSMGGVSLIGASISTDDMKPSLSAGGGATTSVNDPNSGKISSYSASFGFGIPIAPLVSISLGYTYRRYWSATTQAFSANGVINNRISNTYPQDDWNSTDDDNYSIIDYRNPGNYDPLTQVGGTFPNMDDYSVTAQGLGGSIRPYKFSSVLLNQNRINTNNHSNDVYNEMFGYSSNSSTTGKWQFRFINDLSNNYRQLHPWVSDQIFGFDANPVTGSHQTTNVQEDSYGYDGLSNRLEGTNHIEYFTNKEIFSGKAALRGFVTAPDEGGFVRGNCPADQIGGFMITNASGVTYHYALPVYNLKENTHRESVDTGPNFSSNDLSKLAPYAYAWYLTAITGPDYVSRGLTPGLIDKSDWGYWVKFDYGKWTSNYIWRTPSRGMAPDLDGTFQSYSTGVKEIYYLDAVETRSHTAIFEKELRADSKGMALFNNPSQTYSPVVYTLLAGGSTSLGTYQNPITGNAYPVPTLRLKNILLFQNDQLPVDVNSLRQSTTNYNFSFPYSGSFSTPDGIQTVTTGNQVIDTFDVSANPLLLQNCLRRIAFNHDYSLCPGEPNSYDALGTNTYTGTPAAPSKLLGKLTLLSVDFQGKGGASMIPPTQFQYDLDPTDAANQGVVLISQAPDNQQGTIVGPTITNNMSDGCPCSYGPMNETAGMNQTGTVTVISGNYQVGDIISFQFGGQTYYCTLLSTPTNGSIYNVLFLNNSPGSASVNTRVNTVKTKNPPFHFDAYDNWQCYKSDYKADPGNRNLARMTTYVSSLSTDVWSLRQISSSIGTQISVDYESNSYRKSVLNKIPSVIVSNTPGAGNKLNADGTIDVIASVPLNLNLSDLFVSGNTVSGAIFFQISGNGNDNTGVETGSSTAPAIDLDNYPLTKIVSIIGNDIKLQLDPALYSSLETGQVNEWGNPLTATSVYINTANLIPNFTTNLNYGGGSRVKDVKVNDLSGNIRQTTYNYNVMGHFNDATISSGVTSYLPTIMDDISSMPGISADYKYILNKHVNYLTDICRQAPAPGVLYESVEVTNSTTLPNGTSVPSAGMTVYQYEVFKPEMIGLKEYYYEAPTSNSSGTSNGNNTWWHMSTSGSNLKIVKNSARDIAIKDYTSRVGNLKRVIMYDDKGNKLTEKINHYLYDDLDNTSFDNQVAAYEPRLATFTGGQDYHGVFYRDMGVLMERYATARASIDPAHVSSSTSSSQFDELLVMSNQETYPSIATGATQIDYKNGTQTNQTNLEFDFFTGAITKTLTTDSYGNRFLSVGTPAYMAGYANGGISTLKYPALGLMTHDDDPANYAPVQHKQMLKQQSSNYTYAVDASNTPIGVVTATVQTWSNTAPVLDANDVAAPATTQSNIWRMDANYSWMPSGTSTSNVMPYSSFVEYFATGGSSNAAWKKTAQVTQYNVYSAALEATDINNNYAATKMGYNSSRVLVTGGPAQYKEIVYSGAEDALLSTGYFSSNVSPGDLSPGHNSIVADSTKSHTGTHSLSVPSGMHGFAYTLTAATKKNYTASVWVKPTAGNASQAELYYQVDGATAVVPTQTLAKTAAGWYLLEMTVPASVFTGTDTHALIIGCKNASPAALYFDDFRFQPTSASTTAFVYDNQTGELTYILGNNNLYVRYQYDAAGRLVRTYKEVLGKTNVPIASSIVYNYARIVYYNPEVSQVFSSKNCGTNFPQPYLYIVHAKQYSSTVSPADALNQAMNDINTNGQNVANTSGVCLPTISFSLFNSTNSGYQVSFSNPSGSYTFDFSNNGSKTIYVPVGVYSVNIYPTGSPEVVHTITLGNRPSISAPRHIFDSVDVSSGSTEQMDITVF